MNSALSHCLLDFFILFFFCCLKKLIVFPRPICAPLRALDRTMPSTSANSSRTKWQNQWKLKGSSEIFCEFRSCCKSFEDLIIFVFWCIVKSEIRSTQRRKMATWAHPAVLLGKSSEAVLPLLVQPVDCSLCPHVPGRDEFVTILQKYEAEWCDGVTLCDFTAWSQGLHGSPVSMIFYAVTYGVTKVSLLQRNTLSRLLRALRPKWGDKMINF